MTERSRDSRITGALGIMLLAYYLLTLGGHHYSVDGIVIFQSAKQLLFQHSLVLEPPVRWGGNARVSIYGIGMTLAYVPLLALWWPLFHRWPGLKAIPYDPSLAHNPALYANLPYLLCSVLNPLLTAATGCLVFRMARCLGLGPGWSLVAAATYGLASPAAAYARYDFSQPLAGLALTAAAWTLIRSQRSGARAACGAWLACGILTRPELLVLGPWMAAWAGWRDRHRTPRAIALRLAAFAVPVLLTAAAYVWISQLKFGAVGNLGYARPGRLFSTSAAHLLRGLVGLLASPARGLLVFFPLAVLAVPGLMLLSRDRSGPLGRADGTGRGHGAGPLFAGIIAISLLVYGSFAFWWGGVSWGPRFLVPALPIITVSATVWAARTEPRGVRARLMSFAVLALLGFAIAWNGILSDFVEHHRRVARTTEAVDPGEAAFQLASSPLVTGWPGRAGAALDPLWLRLLDANQVRAYGGLLGAARPGAGDRVAVYARLAGAVTALLLLAVILIAARRLWKLARPSAEPAPATPDESFWPRVNATLPSLKGAASTAYYFECERGLFERFLPELAGRSLLKTDLWDEAKNTEILRWAAEQGARPFGVDIAFDIVAAARTILAPHRPNCVAADVRALPFASNAFEVIYSMGTIEHSAGYETAARELARVLKPGGVAIIGVPNKLDPFLRPLLVHVLNGLGLYAYGFEKSFTPGQLRRLLETVGFRVTDQTGILFVPGWLRMMDLWCHARTPRLAIGTALLIRPFAWLYRRAPAIRRHGYLTVCIARKDGERPSGT